LWMLLEQLKMQFISKSYCSLQIFDFKNRKKPEFNPKNGVKSQRFKCISRCV